MFRTAFTSAPGHAAPLTTPTIPSRRNIRRLTGVSPSPGNFDARQPVREAIPFPGITDEADTLYLRGITTSDSGGLILRLKIRGSGKEDPQEFSRRQNSTILTFVRGIMPLIARYQGNVFRESYF